MRRFARAAAPLAAVALVVTACGGEDQVAATGTDTPEEAEPVAAGALDPTDWDAVLEVARGQTVNFHMWGGSNEINQFVDDFYGTRLAEEYDITLNRVPLADTADAVNTVLGELQAGRTDDGSVDLIWINGENFATMRQADALHEGWSELIPNAALVDWDNPAVAFDAGLAVDGAESPWGSAQFQFVYDSARMDESQLPRSYAELRDWIEANPGRFTYPAPPAFHGTRFVKQAWYELSGGHEQWLTDFDEEAFAAGTAPLWAYLEEIAPSLWQQGSTYPNEVADLDRLFANDEVDFTFTQLPAGIQANIDAGVLPATARPYVFDTGTIGDSHYLAIPSNAANPEAAMVLANLALEPKLQAAKLDPANGWGDGIAIAPDRLDADQRAELDAVTASFGPAAVDQGELEDAKLPEVVSDYTEALDRGWDRYIRQGQSRE